MNWFKGYAECYYCKNQEGPWILENQKFICENCYEKYRKKKMKIKEILTKEEIEKIENWYGIINVEQTAQQLEKHILDMEIKDFILYQIWTELENIRYTINDIKEYM